MPLYNTEKYLEEAVNSLVKQTIGFENIQVILIDDGSTDGTANICKIYASKYPNIVYKKTKNRGVSNARNIGIGYVEGKYINFFDGDDKWNFDAFATVYNFFELHSDEINIVVARTRYFGRIEGYLYNLDFRFKKDAIIDIKKQYKYISNAMGPTFFKSDVVKGKKFNTDMKYCEDATFISKRIMEQGKYGVVRDAIFHYRKRFELNSVTDHKHSDLIWYFDTLENYVIELFNYSKAIYGKIIPYVQYQALNDVRFRLRGEAYKTLNSKELSKYENLLNEIIKNIDDKLIIVLHKTPLYFKKHLMQMKYGDDFYKYLGLDDRGITFKNKRFCKIDGSNRFKINSIECKSIKSVDYICIKGTTDFNLLGDSYKLTAEYCKRKYPLELFRMPDDDIHIYNNSKIKEAYGFRIEIPIEIGEELSFIIKKDDAIATLSPDFDTGLSLSRTLENSFLQKGRYVIRQNEKSLNINKNNFLAKIICKYKLYREICK